MPYADKWLHANLAALRALSLGHLREALEGWRVSVEALVLDDGDPLDPRLASATNNVGVGCLLLGHESEARSELTRALHLWTQIRDRISVMDVPVAGRSSTFHLRLAIHHSEAFKEIGRRRYVQWCETAMEITRLNSLIAERRHIERRDYETIVERLAGGFGPRCPEIGILRHFVQGPPGSSADGPSRDGSDPFDSYGEKYSRIVAGGGPSQWDPLTTDAERLEAAAQLTALCDPRLCGLSRQDHQRHAEGQ